MSSSVPWRELFERNRKTAIERFETSQRRSRVPISFEIGPDHDQARSCYVIALTNLYRVEGLILMGTTVETMIHSFSIGGEDQLAGSPLPAAFYESGGDFNEVMQLAESGMSSCVWPNKKLLFPTCKTASPGMDITIVLSGPIDHAAVWGTMIQ